MESEMIAKLERDADYHCENEKRTQVPYVESTAQKEKGYSMDHNNCSCPHTEGCNVQVTQNQDQEA
jgi:hypothetical protein